MIYTAKAFLGNSACLQRHAASSLKSFIKLKSDLEAPRRQKLQAVAK